MSTRHILMTADTVGGIWTYALDLGAALTRRGRRVTLAVLGPPPSDEQAADAAGRTLTLVAVGHQPDALVPNAIALRAAARALARLAAREKADLIHLNHPAFAGDAKFEAPVMAVSHSCVATWWQAVRGIPLPDDFRWRARLHEGGLAAADAVGAPSASFAEATRRLYGFGIAPLTVLHGRQRPAPRAENAALAPSVLTAGRLWDEAKNLAVLDRAAARLPVTVEAAGSLRGSDGTAIILRRIVPLGHLTQPLLRARLAERPIFVSTALYEPFGLAVLEAALAGCALVLSDIPTFRELWGGVAAFVPAHDDRALAAAIVRLLGDRVHRAAQGEAARAHAARYSVEAMADLTERAHAAAIAAADSRNNRLAAKAAS